MHVSTGRGSDGDRKRGLEAPSLREVVLHLGAERVEAGKPPVLSNASEQMDLKGEPIELPIGGREEVDLAPRLCARHRRPGADVEERMRGRHGAERVSEVNSRGGEDYARVHRQVGGRKPESPANPVAGLDCPEKHRRAPEKLGGALDLSRSQKGADPRTAHGSARDLQGRKDPNAYAPLRAAGDQPCGVAASFPSEAERRADDDKAARELPDQDAVDERGGLEIAHGRERRRDDPIDPRGEEAALDVGRQEERRRTALPEGPGRTLERVRNALETVGVGEPPGLGEDELMPSVDAVERSNRDCSPFHAFTLRADGSAPRSVVHAELKRAERAP